MPLSLTKRLNVLYRVNTGWLTKIKTHPNGKSRRELVVINVFSLGKSRNSNKELNLTYLGYLQGPSQSISQDHRKEEGKRQNEKSQHSDGKSSLMKDKELG